MCMHTMDSVDRGVLWDFDMFSEKGVRPPQFTIAADPRSPPHDCLLCS